jgi:hypothetical protein
LLPALQPSPGRPELGDLRSMWSAPPLHPLAAVIVHIAADMHGWLVAEMAT